MQLQFVQQALGEVVLPAGSYSQIRLILKPNPSGNGQAPLNYLTLTTAPSTPIALSTPSGSQSGLKVLGPWVVKPDATVSYKAFIAANGFKLYSSPAVSVTQARATDLGTASLLRLP